MKKIAIVAAAALVLGATGEARAQDWFWGGSYSMSMPLGNTKDFHSAFSLRGVTIEGRKLLNDNVSAGLSFGWHVMNDVQTGTLDLDNAALSGTFYTYTNSFPLFVNAHYYLGQPGGIRPFLGANVGTSIYEQRAEVGQVAFTEDKWRFAVAPEAGVVIPLGWYVRGFLSARYHYMTGSPTQQYVSFNVGIASN
jgi:outer membrane protein